MRVFMTGATGYIGTAVAERLTDAGHVVVGAARSDEAAARLAAAGHESVRASLDDPASLAAAARDAHAVISAGYGPPLGDLDRTAALERAAVDAMTGALAERGGGPKPFLFTTGSGVLGPTGPEPADEDRPPRPAPVLAWKLPIDEAVLAAGRAGQVRSVVVSIPLVHGRGGNPVTLALLDQARRDGEARFTGTGDNHWSAVHVEDLADLYLLALEALATGRLDGGTLLQAAADPTFSMRALAGAVAESTGVGRTGSWTVEQADAASPMPFASLYDSEMRLDATRARRLLGWSPSRPGLLDDLSHGSYAPQAGASR